MDNGQEFTSVIDNPKGDYRNPMTQEEIENKFIDLVRIEIDDVGKIKNIIAFVKEIEKANDINELFSLIES
jgi:2-methylcitrate dehydratase PrpD